jgi:hypothetical protein
LVWRGKGATGGSVTVGALRRYHISCPEGPGSGQGPRDRERGFSRDLQRLRRVASREGGKRSIGVPGGGTPWKPGSPGRVLVLPSAAWGQLPEVLGGFVEVPDLRCWLLGCSEGSGAATGSTVGLPYEQAGRECRWSQCWVTSRSEPCVCRQVSLFECVPRELEHRRLLVGCINGYWVHRCL